MITKNSTSEIPLILFSTSSVDILNLKTFLTDKNFTFGLSVLDFHSRLSKRNFVRLLYAHESWWDERRVEHFAGRILGDSVCVFWIQ